METSLSLSRYLYCKSDIKLSFINCLVKKLDINELYFWIVEWYCSGWDCFDLIWQIYYDFYAILNPTFESYMNKKYLMWKKEQNIYIPITVIKNLYRCESNPIVFILRQYTESIIENKNFKLIEKNKKRISYFKYKSDNTMLLKKFGSGNWEKTCLLLKKYIHDKKNEDKCENNNELFELYREILLISGKINEKKIKEKWKKRGKCLSYHYILAILAIISTNPNKIKKKKIKITLNNDEKNMIQQYCIQDIDKDKYGNKRTYKTLEIKRLYSIHSEFGDCFETPRNKMNYELFKSNCLYHWEYNSKTTPFWKSQFQLYNCTFKNKNPIFDKIKNLDTFYDNFGYELDEQKLEIQDMSLKKYNNSMTYLDWLNSLYENPNFEYPFIFNEKTKLTL